MYIKGQEENPKLHGEDLHGRRRIVECVRVRQVFRSGKNKPHPSREWWLAVKGQAQSCQGDRTKRATTLQHAAFHLASYTLLCCSLQTWPGGVDSRNVFCTELTSTSARASPRSFMSLALNLADHDASTRRCKHCFQESSKFTPPVNGLVFFLMASTP